MIEEAVDLEEGVEGCGATVSFSNWCDCHQEAEAAEGTKHYLGLAAIEQNKQGSDS